MDQSSNRNKSYQRSEGLGGLGTTSTPTDNDPKGDTRNRGAKTFPRPTPMRTPEEQRVGNGYCEYHRQKGHTTNECVQLRQLIDKLVKEGRLDHLVKNIKEGKDKQRSGGKKDAPKRLRLTPSICVQSVAAKTSKNPKLVTEGVHLLRDGEEPLLESTVGRTMELVLEQPKVESTDVLAPTPLRSVPGATVEPPRRDTTSVGSSEDADVAGAESEVGEDDSGLKCKRAPSDDGAGTSKRVRHTQRQHATKVTNSDTGRAAVCALLQRNLDIFAWEPKHMNGVPRSITEHKLKIRQGYSQYGRKNADKLQSALRPFWRRYINSWRQVSCEKSITMTGSPTQLWSKRAMVAGGCA
ncbi:hypothetical protein Tco_1123523 [Tanacetum coccineum]|uniref:Reverse transcriptase domain-containing protein n=1 Tax=Tanacetum coccineum TaxID=301880 RepID=A0ABQ5J6C1_9ASTR